MSMTESESKYGKVVIVGGGRNAGRTMQAQVELLARIDELEAYRAIGTVEEVKALKDDFWKLNEMCRHYSAIGTVEELKAIKQWKSDIIESFSKYDVNSVDELMKRFRELTEKAEPKKMAMKPLRDYDSERDANWCSCPNCFRGIGWEYERHFNFCNECGTEFDWE